MKLRVGDTVNNIKDSWFRLFNYVWRAMSEQLKMGHQELDKWRPHKRLRENKFDLDGERIRIWWY